jgi:hypothetical protein
MGFQSQSETRNQENKKKPMIGSLMMCLSVVVLLVKMLAGIAMRIQKTSRRRTCTSPDRRRTQLCGGGGRWVTITELACDLGPRR